MIIYKQLKNKMKKLIILPSENGFFGRMSDGQLYPYIELIGTQDKRYDAYIVDLDLEVTEDCWFINGYGHVNIANTEFTEPCEFETGAHNQVIIATTDTNLGIDSISKKLLDEIYMLPNNYWVLDLFELLDSEHNIYFTLHTDQLLVDDEYYSEEDFSWKSRRWNIDKTDYIDLSN